MSLTRVIGSITPVRLFSTVNIDLVANPALR